MDSQPTGFCPYCQMDVYDKADTCPNCGSKVIQNQVGGE